MSKIFAPRGKWPMDFPDVVIHSSVAIRNQHPAYTDAKAGDAKAGILLVRDLLSHEETERLGQMIGKKNVILAAVAAIEKTGFNAIPDAMAHEIGKRLGLRIDMGELRQINKVAHTRASGWHRLVTPPLFGGDVEKGSNYVLVDDHVGLGGTLANMRGYIENKGGKVIAMTTLTESRDAHKISLTPETLNVLESKYGQELETFWQNEFGYGFNCLTEVEGGYVARQLSADSVRRCLAAAAEEASSGGLSAIPFRLPAST